MITLGLLVPQTGPSGLWAPSAIASAELAVEELNRSGGVARRGLRMRPIDAGATAATAAEAADEALSDGRIDGIIGMFPSYARRPVTRAIRKRVPFIYTPQFEGFETDPDVVTTGETARELLGPGIAWLAERGRARRFFLCGNDYLWPRISLAVARPFIRAAGGTVVGETYAPIGTRNYEALCLQIAASGADVVLPYFLGSEAIAFHRAFAKAGLAARVIRFTSAADETIVLGLDADATENLYVASAYFGTLGSRNNRAFLERYHTLHGETAPPANSYGQSCYEGVHCFASLVEAVGTCDTTAVMSAVGKVRQRQTARGDERDPIVGEPRPVHVARVDGYDFNVLPTL